MRLREGADEGVHLVDVAVDRLQASGQRRPPDAYNSPFVAADRDFVPATVEQLHEVEDVAVVDWVGLVDERIVRELIRALTGDRRERRLGRETVGLTQLVVRRDPVVTTTLDIDRAQVDHTLETAWRGRVLEAGPRVGHVRTGHLEQRASQPVVDLL